MSQDTLPQSAAPTGRTAVLLVLFFAALTLPWIGRFPFSTRGEPREALVAQAMVTTGEWILPRGYGDDVPSKPPFMHWIIGVVSEISGGVTEFAARFPSAVGSILFLAFFFRFLARRGSRETAWLAVITTGLSIEWFRAAIACRVDMTLAVLLGGALLGLFQWAERGLRGFPLGTALLLVAATWTKGPVSVVLPGLILALFLLSSGERMGRIVGRALFLGLPVIGCAALWYALAWREGGEAFAGKVFYENVARFSSTMEDKPHAHSAFYLWAMFLVGFIPWTLAAAPSALRAIADVVRRRPGVRSLQRSFQALPAFDRYALIVVIAFLAFFSIPSSKRSVYLLPAYPFAAYFIARFIEGRTSPAVWRRAARVLGGTVLVLAGAVLSYRYGFFDLGWFIKKPAALFDAVFFATHLSGIGFASTGPLTLLAALPIALAAVAVVRPPNGSSALPFFVALLGTVYLAAAAVILPAVVEPLSLKRYARDIAGSVPAEAKLYSFGTEFYGVSFYLNREIYRASPDVEPGARVLVLDRNVGEFQQQLRADRSARILSTSTYGVVKPRDRVSLLEVVSGPAPDGAHTAAPADAE